jgi:preprotein translocase subunit SecD
MKKVFLAVLCAGLFFACGNKKAQESEALMDTVPAEVVAEPVAEEVVAEPVAEEPVAQTAPAKKTTTTTKKTNNSTGMTASTSKKTETVEEHAQNAAARVANKAIDKAETETTNAIVNSGKKKR